MRATHSSIPIPVRSATRIRRVNGTTPRWPRRASIPGCMTSMMAMARRAEWVVLSTRETRPTPGANPDSECAACHQPEPWVTAGFSGRLEGPDDAGYPSAAAGHGISCDTCHKIANVDTQKIDFPGIYPGAVTLQSARPRHSGAIRCPGRY